MSFSRFFRLLTALLAFLIGISFAAKANSGKVHYAVGEVYLHRSGDKQVIKTSDPAMSKLKKAKNVKQGDDIETLLESEVIIALPDGSSFNVQENTIVSITKLSFEDGQNDFITEVKRGNMKFDVQKQANSKSNFKFKTGTATAAIRGTDGFFGISSNGCTIASLAKGKLDFLNNKTNNSRSIGDGQTIFTCKDDFIVMDLATSGDSKLFNVLDTILSDTTLSIDAVRKAIEAKDKQLADSLNALKGKINCTFESLPDTVYTSKLSIKATCSEGTHIRIFEDPVRSNGNEIELKVDWAPSTIGQKKIPFTCFFDGDSSATLQCGLLTTYYAGVQDSSELNAKTPLTITSSVPIEVCDPAKATIEGVYDMTDSNATLTVTLGKTTSPNLVPISAGGKFSYSFDVSDKKGNWNENTIYVNYESKNGKQKAAVPLNVKKSCKAVNLIPPAVTIYANKCKAMLALGQTEGDKAIYTLSIDNVPQKEVYFDSDRTFTEKLTQGTHMYKFHVEDLAGNKVELNQRIECYPPLKKAKIVLSETNGKPKRLRVPPTPPSGISNTLHRQLSFTVKNLPQNDPSYIKQIDITLPGETIQLRGTDLQSNRIDQQIKLSRGTTITVKITVTLKSGEILTATQPYEVR